MTGTADALDQIIRRTRCLLLDFDGPICDIFAGHPAPAVAEQLRKLITSQGIQLPADIARTADPIEVFAYSATIGPDLAAKVEAEMADQEVAAVPTARPAPYVHDVVISARESGRTVAVVSNNSERAVRAYLDQHGLDDRIDYIAARTSPDPALLKPDPHLLHQALTELPPRQTNASWSATSPPTCKPPAAPASTASATPTSPARPTPSPRQAQQPSSPASPNSSCRCAPAHCRIKPYWIKDRHRGPHRAGLRPWGPTRRDGRANLWPAGRLLWQRVSWASLS